MAKKNTAGRLSGNEVPELTGVSDAGEQCVIADIIAGCREFNPESQERLYKKYFGYALGVALAYCSSREDADEVVNDSFIKVFRNIKKYKTSEPFRPWIRKIVVHTSIDKIRAGRRFRDQVAIDDFEQISHIDIESEMNASQIYRLLNELPDLLRFVFNMYEIEGYSHREIAERLEIAESSSRTYLGRAKSRLRHLYRTLFMDKQ